MDATADLSDEDLNRINQRLERVLNRFGAMPYHSLLYRLGEVASNRIEERKLRRALAELMNNRRPRSGRVPKPGPWEGRSRVYVSPDASQNEAALAADNAITALHELAAYCGTGVIDGLADALKSTLNARDSHRALPATQPIVLGGDVEYHAETRHLRIKKRRTRSSVNVLVLHEPSWLYPDDQRLWQFLIDSHHDGARAVIVARAIAPGTFPLFKALGVVGAQYFSTLTMDEHAHEAKRLRDTLGWSYVRGVGEMATHPIIDHLNGTIERVAREYPTTAMRRALDQAEARGLIAQPNIANVLRWWHASDLVLPSAVVQGWVRWTTWDAYRRRRSKRSGGTATLAIGQGDGNFQNSTWDGKDAESAEDAEYGKPSRGFGRDTQVIRIGLPLSPREVKEILASARRSRRQKSSS